MTIFDQLKAPFNPDRVSWRVGSTTGDKKRGMVLAYVDARDMMERLDEIVGPAGWQCDYPHANGKTVCRIGIKFDGEWIWKADGAGDTDFEAEKGALSDAFKRAAVRWGIGRYLYDVPASWVEIEPAGKSFKIKESEHAKLRGLLSRIPSPSIQVVETDTKILFIAECKKKIAKHRDRVTAITWWNSEDEKQKRRDFELNTDEVNQLKELVLAIPQTTVLNAG